METLFDQWLNRSFVPQEVHELRRSYEFSEKFDAARELRRMHRKSLRGDLGIREAFRGLLRTMIPFCAKGIFLGLILGPVLEVIYQHETAAIAIAHGLKGLWLGPLIIASIAVYMSIPHLVARNGRVATLPIWSGTFGAVALAASVSEEFLGSPYSIKSWIAVGTAFGSTIGLLTGVSTRMSAVKLAKRIEETNSERIDIAVAIFKAIVDNPSAIGGVFVGVGVAVLWALVGYSLASIGLIHGWDGPAGVAEFALLGTAIGMGSAAVLTPGQTFYGRWDSETMREKANIIATDGKSWDGRRLDEIAELRVSGTEVRARDFTLFIGQKLPNLRRIDVGGCNIGDYWMEYLFPAENLEYLDLTFTRGKGYWLLTTAFNLRVIQLTGTKFGARFELLALYPKLQSVWFGPPSGGSDQAAPLTNIPNECVESVVSQRPIAINGHYRTVPVQTSA